MKNSTNRNLPLSRAEMPLSRFQGMNIRQGDRSSKLTKSNTVSCDLTGAER